MTQATEEDRREQEHLDRLLEGLVNDLGDFMLSPPQS